jgi:glycosyltransferase involved in cell wall biosynthesis
VKKSFELLSAFSSQSNFTLKHFKYSKSNYILRKIRSFAEPFSEAKYADGVGETLRREMEDGYDILHIEQLWTGWLGLNNPKALLNIHHFEIIDWEDKKLKTWRERKTLLQMKRATKKILKGNINIRVFTERLYNKAVQINPNARYWTVPFSLDLSLYPLQPFVREPIVGLFGSMHWEPTRSAAIRLLTRIWPLIKEKMPDAKLFIAGWNADKYLLKYMPMEDVTLEENLNHPTDFFSKVAVMVYAPSKGSGFKVKVLESMAYGVPVVTTWEGVEGLDYENGKHCFVEESDEMIAEKVVVLLKSIDLRNLVRMEARELLQTKYLPYETVKNIINIYEVMLDA